MDIFEAAMRWIIAPIAIVVWMMYQRQQTHSTKLAVLQNQSDMLRVTYDREIRDIKDMLHKILEKLDDKADR